MGFLKKLPVWSKKGVEPPNSKKTVGWQEDERPPAEYMNWFQNTTYEAVDELQKNAVHKDDFNQRTNELTTQLADVVNLPTYPEISLDRVSRFLHENGLYKTPASENYYFGQGSCYTGDGKVVYALRGSTSNNNARLIEVGADGTILKDTIIELYHANWISFNPSRNELYISSLKKYDSGLGMNVASSLVFVIDYSSFNIKSTMNFADKIQENIEGVLSFSYDIKTDKYYMVTEISSNTCKLYEVNFSTLDISLMTNPLYDEIFNTTSNQGVCVYDNRAYFLKYKPNVIASFDFRDNSITYYNIPYVANDKFLVGEVEQISPVFDNDGNFYLSTTHIMNNFGENHVVQFFKLNFKNSIPTKRNSDFDLIGRDIYVDITSTAKNPDGTPSNPFKDINEALELTINPMYSVMTINIKNGTYPFVSLYNANAFVTIASVSKDNTKVLINGARIKGTKIKFDSVSLKTNSTVFVEDINSTQSDITLNNTKLLSTTNNIYVNDSRLSLMDNNVFSSSIPIVSENFTEIKSNPYSMPKFKKISGNVLTTPNTFLLNGALNVNGVGTSYGYSFTAPDLETLKTCKGLKVRISVDGNVFYPEVRFSDFIVYSSGGSGIQLTASGFPNNVDTTAQQDFSTYEIRIQVTTTQIYIEGITRLMTRFSSSNSQTFIRENLTGTLSTFLINQIWCIN